ncbi:MAG: DUF4920 domain-containing protein [Pyrinomonadaceae bacterium]
MKKFLNLSILILALSLASFAQEKMTMHPTDKDKTEAIPTAGILKRGAPLSNDAQKVSLAKLLAEPDKYKGQTVRVEGVIVRSCKMEGCWLELAPDAKSKSVRVNMKDHSFFVPLDSAGAKAKVEGTVAIKILSKQQVDRLTAEDGARFDNRKPDGTVTEVSFTATGVELTKATR